VDLMLRSVFHAVIAAGILFSGTMSAASPQVWVIDPGQSSFDIIYEINGKQRSGVLNRFSGRAEFDPTDMEAARLDLVVDMDSIDVGDRFGTAIVKTSDWFDVFNHPVANYRLNRMTSLGDGRFLAVGTLTRSGTQSEGEGVIESEMETGGERTDGGEK